MARSKKPSPTSASPSDFKKLFKQLDAKAQRAEGLGPEKSGHSRLSSRKQPRSKISPTEQRLNELFEAALYTKSPEEAYRFMKEAYQLDPNDPEILGMLAETAPGLNEQLKWQLLETEALRKAIPVNVWKGLHGQLWMEHAARPYLRSMYDLAEMYHYLGRFDEAIETCRELMRLNTNDNQGVRETLLKWLMELNRFDEALALIEKMPTDGLMAMCFTFPLLVFRYEGDSPRAKALLKQAKKRNKHTAALLLGEVVLEEIRADAVLASSSEEAHIYAQNFRIHWVNTPGALNWLSEKTKTKRRTPEAGISPQLEAAVLTLPIQETGWLMNYRQIPSLVKKGRKIFILWAVMILDTQTGLMIANEVMEEEPTVARLLDVLLDCMRDPKVSEIKPQRPKNIVVARRESAMLLGQYLKVLDIGLIVHDKLPPTDEAFDEMIRMTSREELRRPSISNVPGITPEDREEFYQNATDCYRLAPWSRAVQERLIRVECPMLRAEPYFATIMGTLGITHGIAVYLDEAGVRAVFQDQMDYSQIQSAVLRFDYPFELSAVDLINIDKHGYATPGMNVIPNLMMVEKGKKIVQPTWAAFRLVSLLAVAIPQLVQHRKMNDPTVIEYRDQQHPERVVTLSWDQNSLPW